MEKETHVGRLARFVARSSYEDLSDEAVRQLKVRVLDALGCAIGALGGEPVRMVREQLEEFGGNPLASLIGGGRTAPDRAALYNGALVRYLDYNDSFLAPGETCHPSDNLGAVLAAAEYAGGGGRDLLLSLAVAYQVQCRLSEVAPVRHKGFDHTTQGAYAAAAGVAKALGLDERRTANAIAISGTANNALRVTRTGALSHWKGLAYPNTAFAATHAAFLAMRGITGPPEVFEGNKGFMDAIAGRFEIDWEREDLELVRRTIVKKYNAEIHSQSALEGLLELRERHGLDPRAVERVELETFDVAYNIIGGGEEGSKHVVRTKEEADHSLPYMLAVALLDGEVGPEQYRPERIRAGDVQGLLRRVEVRPADDLSRRFPEEMPCRLRVFTGDGEKLEIEKKDYEGFFTRPLSWEGALGKFGRLCASIDKGLREEISGAVERLEEVEVSELASLLRKVRTG
ncbi:2-methylcitrate dehydratase [Rubrobacter xylanophilus DSM 9941]|uniref:2-methylcitrate dehydratase n=1 Tax=Rubrobacter xylanophilus (strain DSM 9941 / JCM 11954 / NBRC 16129 / PRD-1) TaxID=266117 RepID=Q1ASZ7_RUBXD|nr:MmgE/PrpD family protein [Rubrobacter xylanophilus]ABG05481.1 2-methylcitrate dehydratase [Rubrobacter xylanophilus DSM 9941]